MVVCGDSGIKHALRRGTPVSVRTRSRHAVFANRCAHLTLRAGVACAQQIRRMLGSIRHARGSGAFATVFVDGVLVKATLFSI